MNRSRSIVLSIVLLTITAAGASAQSTTTLSTIHYGVMAGANLFELHASNNSFDNKSKFGYNAGIYAEVPVKGRWGLQPELLFNEFEAKTADQFNNLYQGASFQNVSFSYITLPILVTFRASDAFTILAGPQYGYMVYQTQGLTLPPDPKDAFNKSDFSILFGGQLNVIKRMKLGARYVIGFTQLNHIDDNTDSWKNHGLQVYLTYRLK